MEASPRLNDERTRAWLDRLVAGLILAGCLAIPLAFVPGRRDAFALPKSALGAFLMATALTVSAISVLRAGPGPATRPGRLLGVVIIGFALVNVAAWVASVDRRQSLLGERFQYQGLCALGLYVGCFYLSRSCLGTVSRLRILYTVCAVAGVLVAGFALLQRAGLDPIWGWREGGRVFSSIGQPNAVAAYLVLVVPMMLALASAAATRWTRIALCGCLVIVLAATGLTLSRGGYLGLLVAVSVFLGCMRTGEDHRRWSKKWVMVVAACAVGLGLILIAAPVRSAITRVYERVMSATDLGGRSVERRLALWKVAVAITLDHPLLGTGQETFPLVFPLYRDRVLDPTTAADFSAVRPESPHNAYLAVACGAGVPALALYLFVLVVVIRVIGRSLGSRSGRGSRVLLSAALAAVMGHIVTDAFMTTEVTGSWLFWVVVGAAVGASQSVAPALAPVGKVPKQESCAGWGTVARMGDGPAGDCEGRAGSPPVGQGTPPFHAADSVLYRHEERG